MARKNLKSLEKLYEVDSFFDYIMKSVDEDHQGQTKELYNELKPTDQKRFILQAVENEDKQFLIRLFNSIF